MEKIKWPVTLVTAYLLFYLLAPYLGFNDGIVILMYLFAPVAVIWMVIKILRQGIPSRRSFEDYFYEDLDEKRNVAAHDEPDDLL